MPLGSDSALDCAGTVALGEGMVLDIVSAASGGERMDGQRRRRWQTDLQWDEPHATRVLLKCPFPYSVIDADHPGPGQGNDVRTIPQC